MRHDEHDEQADGRRAPLRPGAEFGGGIVRLEGEEADEAVQGREAADDADLPLRRER